MVHRQAEYPGRLRSLRVREISVARYDVDLWPSITHIHLAMNLLYTPSRYTGEELLSYKSLDCYIYVVSGWAREVLVKTLDK